jgi:hypothetical protein
MSRVTFTFDTPVLFQPTELSRQTLFYPPRVADLNGLNVKANDPNSRFLNEYSSAASGVDLETMNDHSLVAFPMAFDWDNLWNQNHAAHMEFIRSMSEMVDDRCLNVIRYYSCRIEPADDLPGHAGQIESNHMMAGAVLYNAGIRRAESSVVLHSHTSSLRV